MTPHPVLTELYGNEVLLEKEATMGKVLLALVAMKALDSFHTDLAAHQQASFVQAEAMRRDPEMDNVMMRMRYSHPPLMIAPMMAQRSGSQQEVEYGLGVMPSVPLGMDSGMVRLAMVAGSTGEMLAKQAAVAPTIAPGLRERVIERVLGGAKDALRRAKNKVPGAVQHGAHGTIGAEPIKDAFKSHVYVSGKPDAGPSLAAKALGVGAAGAGLYGLHQGVSHAMSPSVAPAVEKQAGIGSFAGGLVNSAKAGIKAVGSRVPVIGAKGIGKPGLLGSAAILAGAGAGAYGLTQGVRKATEWGSEEKEPTNWSHTDYGAAPLVKNVNEFGYT